MNEAKNALKEIVAVTQKMEVGCEDCYTAACIANGALARMGEGVAPESLKLQRCDMCGTVAMPDSVVGCRACGWDEMRQFIPGERLFTQERYAKALAERDEARAALATQPPEQAT